MDLYVCFCQAIDTNDKRTPHYSPLSMINDSVLKKVYLEYREPFINYARKFQLEKRYIVDEEENGFDFERKGISLTKKTGSPQKNGGRCRNILELFYYHGMTIE